jgi:cell fate (sporulation/competence/biofilm development) regulator YmcA (YheA/YmcA/DUF963 family)
MGIMNVKTRQEFQKLHLSGLKAQYSQKHAAALKWFEEADILASHTNNDRRRRLDALNPMAQALWALGDFKKAEQKIAQAATIASELGLRDELAVAFSNFGRLEAVKIIKQKSVSRQASNLRKNALPYFIKTQKMLAGHKNLNYRYTNAQYGSLVAALAQDYKKSALLVTEGMDIAFKRAKYSKDPVYKLNPSGLEYFAVASELIRLGVQNPLSHAYKAKEKLARELVK